MKSSIYRGVAWAKLSKKWQAYVYKDGEMIHLGHFTDEKIAAQVRDNALVDFGCDVSKLNFPERQSLSFSKGVNSAAGGGDKELKRRTEEH